VFLAFAVRPLHFLIGTAAINGAATRSRSEKYQPRLLSQATWVIIALNIALNTVNRTLYSRTRVE
jgi:uncharacterized membrane protein AbrB (regulator of aidB expression)